MKMKKNNLQKFLQSIQKRVNLLIQIKVLNYHLQKRNNLNKKAKCLGRD